jgi:DNA polymerase-3 subunit delta'
VAWNVVGHERAVELLRRSVAQNRVSHAYLFSGPSRIGKHTLAIELARALNCEGTEDVPCGTCRRCRLIGEGKHPEVRTVSLQPPHRVIRVADVESMQADAALRPADVSRKVYIVEQAELLHPDAAARLLKTIEEPPPAVVIVLTTVDSEATLPTIVSRCQQVRLRALPRRELAEYLVRTRSVAAEQADLLAALSEGRLGWALDALEDAKILDRRAAALDQLDELVLADRVERLAQSRALADRWGTRPEIVRETLDIWLRWWRDVLLIQRDAASGVVNLDRRDTLERHAHLMSPRIVAGAVASARDTLVMLDQNVNARLALDVLLLDLPRASADPRGAIS